MPPRASPSSVVLSKAATPPVLDRTGLLA